MAKSVVICEKPSQAKAIKAAVGNRYGVVLPARGHILTLKEPHEVREDWKEWSAELLWPGGFYPKKPVKDTQSLLSEIRKEAEGADRIIIATDCDREGQLIGDEIVDFIKFDGQVMRAIFNAEDPKSLQESFSNLIPNQKYHGLYMAGQAREQADQTTNLSLTRAATVTLKAPGAKGAIGIGRVKTPVLGIVCKRELEIKNFVSRDLFEIDATTQVEHGSMILTCAKLPNSLVKEQDSSSDDVVEEDDLSEGEEALAAVDPLRGKIADERIAKGIRDAAIGFSGPLNAKFEKKRQGPPKLFDLTAMQAACSSKFGWSGEQTLSIAQSLYAAPHHILTYPRGEAQYLPENNIKDVPALLKALFDTHDFGKFSSLIGEPKVRKGKTGHFSNAALEGLSHYAIIPNVNSAETFSNVYPRLTADQKKLFDLVSRQYLAAFAPDFEYRQTTAEIVVPWKGHNWTFRNSGRVPLVLGWKEILGGSGQPGEENTNFPQMKSGETAHIEKAALRIVKTKPPARYTEGALIKVMKEAWRLVDDPQKRERLKEAKGIGTPATRGDVVKGLFTQGQLAMKGKSIMPTEGGLKLYQTLVQVCPNVVDPARTAAWEMLFDFVEKGKMTADDAVEKILSSAKQEIKNICNASVQIEIGRKSKPTSKMIAAAKKIAEVKKIKLPTGVTTDSMKCRAFLQEHIKPRAKNPDGSLADYQPSEKQVSFAQSLAERSGLELPQDILQSAKKLSEWINTAKDAAPPLPPTEKQLAFAEKLSNASGTSIPVDALKSAAKMSEWMEAAKKKNPVFAPSEKQLAFARSLAEGKGIDLPEKVLVDAKECSNFIKKNSK